MGDIKRYVGKKIYVKFNHIGLGEVDYKGKLLYVVNDLAFVLKKDEDGNSIVVHLENVIEIKELT
jgi:hypothetical protein